MKPLFTLFALFIAGITFNEGYEVRNILSSQITKDSFKPDNSSLDNIRKDILLDIQHSLASLTGKEKQQLIQQAEDASKQPWLQRKLSDWLDWSRKHNRSQYDTIVDHNLKQLSQLALGELILRTTNKTNLKYINQIADGVWALCQETTWSVPREYYSDRNRQNEIPDPKVNLIDPPAAETGKIIAWLQFLFAKDFDAISLKLNQRIKAELQQRLFEPLIKSPKDFVWTGYQNEHFASSWNVWINTAVLKAALLTIVNSQDFNTLADRLLHLIDNSFNNLGDDGACPNGVEEWRHFGGSMIDLFEMLTRIYHDQEYLKKQKLFQEIGDFPRKLWITNNTYVAFGDSSARVDLPPVLFASYDQFFEAKQMDQKLKRFALYQANITKGFDQKVAFNDLNDFWIYSQKRSYYEGDRVSTPFGFAVYDWLPSVGILIARSTDQYKNLEKSQNYFLAAQAGENDLATITSHNDIGNFIVYYNNHPFIIDIGRTNSSIDYLDHFTYQSAYHNVPIINGFQQGAGPSFKAKNVQSEARYLMADISHAYPLEAKVISYNRLIQMDSANYIRIRDEYNLTALIKPLQLTFVTVNTMKLIDHKYGLVMINEVGVQLLLEFDRNLFDYVISTKSFEGDRLLETVWGQPKVKLIRLSIKEINQDTSGAFTVRFLSNF